MASTAYQNSILWRGEDPQQARFKAKVDASRKIERYRPGQAPKWAQEGSSKKHKSQEGREQREVDKIVEEGRRGRRGQGSRSRARSRSRSRGRKKEPIKAAVVLEDAASSRLKRLRETSANTATIDASERLRRHRVIHEARVLEAAEEKDDTEELKTEDHSAEGRVGVAELKLPAYDEISGDDEEDNQLRTLRRESAREAALAKRKEEEEELLKQEEKEEVAEEDVGSESEESDSDDDDPRQSLMLKPVFVTKAQRETVKEKEALQKEEEVQRERAEEKHRERKAESKTLLVDTIRADDEAEAAGVNENDGSDIELIDDNDETNEAEEYELWKIRELKRIKRDKEERLARQEELEFIERRRRMTDAEREADDRRLDGGAVKREEVKQFNFLQKYYHRGGFFQDKAVSGEEPLYLRDFHEPTADDNFDKNTLPKPMQVRRGLFGKKGQVKHTHLTDVDTTDKSAAWSQHSKVMQKYQEKMAGVKGANVFDRSTLAGSSSSRAAPP